MHSESEKTEFQETERYADQPEVICRIQVTPSS